MHELCSICGCELHRDGDYGTPSVKGRSHSTAHHYVAERYFGRSANRSGTLREALFKECPWNLERKSAVYCYDCHEDLLHNPVFTEQDIAMFSDLVRQRGLNEGEKSEDRSKLAGRIQLLHEVIQAGLKALNSRD